MENEKISPIDYPRYIADKYQDLFNYMSKQHGLTLLISEMDEIITLAQLTIKNINKI